MKLFSKYNRVNLLFTVTVFIAGSIAFSMLIRYVVNKQTDGDLVIEKDEITTYVNQFHILPVIENTPNQQISFKITHPRLTDRMRLYTTQRWNPEEHDHEPARSIEWYMQAQGNYYQIIVSKSLDVTEDLIRSIILITICLILLILLAGFFVNRLLLRRLWQPFYRAIEKVQQFKLSDTNQIRLDTSSVEEFNLMNSTLQNALNKARNDYFALKEFTENASHELQTPLAVISSKLDVIIQSEALTQSQSEAVGSAYEAVKTLKKLNQSLLLLAKIENRQFDDKSDIDILHLIEEKQKLFAEQWQSKEIEMRISLKSATLFANRQLIDILLNNLLSNAIRHNTEKGFVSLQLQPGQINISNSGKPQPLDELYIFNRFYKGTSDEVHHGLGLSIIKQICDASACICRYQFTYPNIHSFVIIWQ